MKEQKKIQEGLITKLLSTRGHIVYRLRNKDSND
uniref:Translation initiation factor 1 n=1 Tax=Lophopyxis maingayi TaxID=125041 RepID=A0A7G8QDY0_9ROSI|nr:translation initiation factor 1 [Lophopyxis maingayi]QNK04988.1 translation initiation factor 1 [Lophopyxis maingayi]